MNVQAVAGSGPLISAAAPESDKAVDEVTELFQQKMTLQSSLGTVKAVVEYIPGAEVIDLSFRLFLRLVASITALVRTTPLFSEETLLTSKQKSRIVDLTKKQQELASVDECATLCKLTGTLIDETIPQVVADILQDVPSFAEETAVYTLWMSFPFFSRLGVRYLNRQVQMRAGVRDAAVHSVFVQSLGRAYTALSSRCTQAVIKKSLTNPWVDFEHLVVTLCSKLQEVHASMLEDLKKQRPDAPETPKNIGLMLRSLAIVMSRQHSIDKFIAQKQLEGDAACFIARLVWHKNDGTLPPGVPDPSKVSLTPDNLAVELRKALDAHMETVVELFLNKYAPKSMRYNLIYWLEGKQLLVKIFTNLLVDCGVEQLVNPHQLAILVLSAAGYKTEELELDKFGPRTNEQILKTGQKMIQEALKEKPDSEAILWHFTHAQLKASPGGLEAEEQKRDVKRLLTKHVSELIEKHLGGDMKRSSESGLQDKAFGLTNVANVGLQVLISTTVFYYKELMGANRGGKSLSQTVKTTIAGQTELLDVMANKVVELIYHPSWRITVLHLINGFVQSLITPDHKKAVTEDDCRRYFKSITTFLYGHISQDLLGKFANALTGDLAYEKFRASVQPNGEASLLQKGVPVLLPLVKELLLYERVTQYFRGIGVQFAGDTKFWEIFVRFYLNEIESFNLSKKGHTQFVLDQVENRAAIRKQALTAFAELEPIQLLKILAKPADCHPEFIPPQTAIRKTPITHVTDTDILKVTDAEPGTKGITIDVIEDYSN